MLVLTRKVGDVIAIGDNINIVVMSIKGKQVRLGIEADKDTIVHREEIYQKIQKENTQATEANVQRAQKATEIFAEESRPTSSPKPSIRIRRRSTES